ncbi:MAG: hypothetical protein GXN98_00080 [Euryarchaeota archaeon]|nr:hypothetical protein [Euryarchaeota archaeon]
MYYEGRCAVIGGFEKLGKGEARLLEEAFKRCERVSIYVIADLDEKQLRRVLRKLEQYLRARYPGRYEVKLMEGMEEVAESDAHTLLVPYAELAEKVNALRERAGMRRMEVVVPPASNGD